MEKFYYLSGRYELELAVGDAAMVCTYSFVLLLWSQLVCIADFLCAPRKIHFYNPLATWSWTCQRPQKRRHVLRHRLLTHSQNLGQRQRYHTYSVHQRRGHLRNSHLHSRVSHFFLSSDSWLGWVKKSCYLRVPYIWYESKFMLAITQFMAFFCSSCVLAWTWRTSPPCQDRLHLRHFSMQE